ncbi:hypothetical protein BMS3Abin03_03211 [bacterium BMS3Abin03]|nr:hypothetical protein BMS3Abin03_03211 [bacterium BMS3Abin03]
MFIISCAGLEDQEMKVSKISESINGINLSVSLIGSSELTCKGKVKYKNYTLKDFVIKSFDYARPTEVKIDYSEFPNLATELAADFVLNKNTKLEVIIFNKENEFLRTESVPLNPHIPPVMTGIELQTKEIARRFPVGYNQESDDVESYLANKHYPYNKYTLEQITTISLLLKTNSRILLSVVLPDQDIPVYKGLDHIKVSVLCDSNKPEPFLILYPTADNIYYDGPGFYQLVNKHYRERKDEDQTITPYEGRFLVQREFKTNGLIGEYNLLFALADDDNNYFYYNLGSLILDNIAPQFDRWSIGEYSFSGNELFEGKVYLDYRLATGNNPYNVIFSGKVFGDIKKLFVNGKKVKFKKDGDLLFTQKINIRSGYKDLTIGIVDNSGNEGNYILPVVVP